MTIMIACYQILEHICTTAGSHLYHARSVKDDTPALVKTLNSKNILPQHLSRFQREYEALQSHDIPGVIQPIAFLSDEGQPLMVLEDCAGEPFDSFLNQHALEVPTCLRLGSGLARILAGLHAAHLIHRDIRPVNFMLDTQHNQLCLLDLSLAIVDTQNVSVPEHELPGDWAYVSPEQTGRMNRPVDYRTDFYSLGIMLYRMLTGQLPFQGNDPLEWMHCHIARSPPPPCDIAPHIPEVVSDIVLKLLAKLPEERYQSAHGLQADLERCLAQWQARGRIEPFPLCREDVSERFHIPHKLYGRERETTTLLAAFDHMAATGGAALVTVSGYSGIGKSSLVHKLHQPIVRERGYFIAGKFDQLMRDIPYATLTQAFRDLVQQLLAESEARIADWRQRIQAAVGINGQLIVDVLPQVELIIGKQAPVQALPPAEAQNRFRLVFQRFIAVFTRQEHPLALFLDDVQWADAASLQFIEHLLTQPDTRYLLLIAAYRDNEVSAAHPLTATLETIRNNGAAAVIDIRLAPLSVMPLNQLVADTLHTKAAMCEPLTRLIFERTEGNPFFFTQFLDALYQEEVLRHDRQERVWQWDLAHIKARDFADNVADLMAAKLRRLPAPAQEALQLAACLGNKFDLRALALVSRLAEESVAQRLSAAAREDLIVLTSEHGKFLHDRIQQAAYALIPEGQRAALHLQIGRLLSAGTAPEDSGENLFEIVNQLNRGAMLITLQEERERVARFNLVAGKRAKTSTAYASTLAYLVTGRALLAKDSWELQYPLTFAFEFHRAECEFLTGEVEAAEERLSKLACRAANLVDMAAVAGLRVDLYTTLDRFERSVEVCLDYLRRVGVQWSSHPTQDEVRQEYERLWRQIGSRTIEELIDLPPMNEPDWRATLDVLASALAPAMFTDQKLYYLMVGRMANISLEHGNCDASCIAYVWLGRILGPGFGDYRAAFRFGKLGVDLVEQRGPDRFRAKIYVGFGALVNPWNKHMRSGRVLVQRAFDMGNESGDFTYAAFSCDCLVANYLACGDRLVEIQREAENGLAFAQKIRFGLVVDIITGQLRLIRTLRGLTPHFSSFNDDEFDESRFEQHLDGDPSLALPACWYWIRKLQARFYAGDYPSAIESALKAQRLLWTSPSFFEVAEYHFYAALARAAHYAAAAADERPQHLEALTAHHKQLEVWAENCPENFQNRAALVAAEVARIDGRDLDAMRLYEQAIQSARENGFVHNEGVAHETAASFYLARGITTSARVHLEEARSCFARWGADGKVRQLEERYPQLRAQAASPTAVASDTGMAQLDVLSVAKASQAISGRIVLDELIDTLMRIVLENAGAQSGALLLMRGDDLVLAAEASVAQQTVQVQLQLGQAVPESALPTAILNYVRRSREPVLLADATEPNPFSGDPYFAGRRPKSMLCLPIVRQATLVGVLYLENTLVTHAFTPARMNVLELLASQAAISLENALLYTDLQQENNERKRAEATVREREARIRRLVESNIIGIIFWDLAGAITDANDAFLQMVGYSRQELLSGKIDWTSMTPPEHHAADIQRIEELRCTGSIPSFEKEFLRKDGSRIPTLMGAAFIDDSQETGVSFVLDLTERKQAEAEREARQAADAANRAKSAFLANMSHELRTPLNGILGYAQILQRDKTLDERQIMGLNVIQQSGEHLLTMINDILDLAKIEAGKLELNPVPIELTEFLHVIGDIINVKAAQKGLDFILDMAPDLPLWIQVDEKRLRQVLLNLLANAVRFTDRGQVALRVCLTPSARLRFAVQDTGVGISETQLDTIFQPFEQAGETRRRLGGTGLGLAISRQFVRLMNGEIRVESRIGQGSTFWFELETPVVKAEAAPLLAKSIVTGYAGPRKTVLVVDDMAGNRAVVIDMLRPLGFVMAEAANGREGLDKAQTLQPDLILMDIVMPEMDGLEATRRLRQWPARKEVPVIAISASASGGDEASSLAAGASAFLPKPISLARLLAQIGSLLKLTWIEAPVTAQPSPEREAEAELVAPPPEEMEILHYLARRGNMQDILQRASHLARLDERYRPFADRLSLLAKEYRSKTILSLVEQYLEKGRVVNSNLSQ